MQRPRPWTRRVGAEAVRGYPLEQVLRALGYRRTPDLAARWRRPGSVVSINGFMFYDHRCGEGGGGAIDLVIHARRCTAIEALDFLAALPCAGALPAESCPAGPPRPEPHWPALRRYPVERRGIAEVLVELCRDLGLLYADARANPAFIRRNAAGRAIGVEIVSGTEPRRVDPNGGFWLSWEPRWPRTVILAKSALDALSVLSMHPLAADHEACAVVSTGAATPTLPRWIAPWNPSRIFCAYDATRHGDRAAARLARRDTRIVRLRPAIEGEDWNDMLMRERAGEPLETDLRPLD